MQPNFDWKKLNFIVEAKSLGSGRTLMRLSVDIKAIDESWAWTWGGTGPGPI